ncbi:MAG: SnoaL-like domain-containing protein [Cyclobacteriaceae bacterium]|nr:SnoaL-like domain-containing protein [Cyclobacteriaceae bacterium]
MLGFAASAQKPGVLIVKEWRNQYTSPSDIETVNAAMAVSESILKANWARLDSLLDDGYTYTGDGFVFTKDQYIGFMQEMRSAFSDFEMTLEKAVVTGDLVSIQFVSKAANTGKFMGAPATKKHLEVNGIFMRKVKDGKILQEWQTTDLLGTMKQIGGGALFFYAVFVGGFNAKQKPPVRKPNDFLNIKGNVDAFDKMSSKAKKRYLKTYYRNRLKKTK